MSRWLRVLFWGVWAGCLLMFPLPALAAPGEGGNTPAAAPGSPPGPEASRTILLDPFYLVQEDNSRCWVERLLVEVDLAGPEPPPAPDFSDPGYRKLLYEQLRSGKTGKSLEADTRAALNAQARREVVRAVRISRSVLMVR